MAIVVEEEQADAVQFGVVVDPDLIAQGLPRPRRAAVEGQLAAEQAVDPLAAVEQVDAQPADQQQVGLTGLDEDARRHPAGAVEIPAVPVDIGFGPDRAGAHRARDGVDAGHAVGQQHRRLRHPRLAVVAVLLREQRTEEIGNRAAGEVFQLRAIELRTGKAVWIHSGQNGRKLRSEWHTSAIRQRDLRQVGELRDDTAGFAGLRPGRAETSEQSGMVDGDARGDQLGRDLGNPADTAAVRSIERDGQVFAAGEGPADPARAQRLRAVLDEHADAVVPGPFDRAGEIHGSDGLRGERVRDPLSRRHVRVVGATAVEPDARRWRGGPAVQATPFVAHLRQLRRVHGQVIRDRQRVIGVEACQDALACSGIATDDARIG